MTRKGFKTSPSIRIPKATASKMHAAAAAELALQEIIQLRGALRFTVGILDRERLQPKNAWCHTDPEEIELRKVRALVSP
jgi:hypothetical protein